MAEAGSNARDATENRHTFEAQFRWDMSSPEAKARRRQEIAEILWRYVRDGGKDPGRRI